MPCNKTENGQLVNEPYRMQDGRAFTDYRSSNDLVREVRQILDKNGCMSDSTYQFKLCLIRNTNSIANYFEKKNFEKNGVYKCN